MMNNRRATIILLSAIVILAVISSMLWFFQPGGSTTTQSPEPLSFNGQRAYEDVKQQVAFGPRTPNSPGHAQTVAWIEAELKQEAWETEIQDTVQMGDPIRNIVGKRQIGIDGGPWIIIGAHYDTRLLSNQDPDEAKRNQPVPGANDGASGVAVLLELARILPANFDAQTEKITSGNVWLVFFDAEDNGGGAGKDWILGSRAFVASLTNQPDAVVVVDMIGDSDLNIYQEKNSDRQLTEEIWGQAAALGYSEQFIAQPKYRILDDHIPFLEAGIPAVDLIDFDYPFWHTTADTPDKVSAESLQAVGETLLAWLINRLAQ